MGLRRVRDVVAHRTVDAAAPLELHLARMHPDGARHRRLTPAALPDRGNIKGTLFLLGREKGGQAPLPWTDDDESITAPPKIKFEEVSNLMLSVIVRMGTPSPRSSLHTHHYDRH